MRHEAVSVIGAGFIDAIETEQELAEMLHVVRSFVVTLESVRIVSVRKTNREWIIESDGTRVVAGDETEAIRAARKLEEHHLQRDRVVIRSFRDESGATLPEAVRRSLADLLVEKHGAQKIQAVAEFRRATGERLKTSKEAIDAAFQRRLDREMSGAE